ncbi:hypothetical protein Vadar_024032 [Vaccinium darrowii]|uniref:Uncharacterized protein n=1 Tax=Vaccinium darrowii TaxID=229202 RepID=A0ACB7X3F3_9ERIC|nr:hypothetical protein Vadar_024032 [Vaccinium darrowii]
MVFSSIPAYLDPSNGQQQSNAHQVGISGSHQLPPPPPPHGSGVGGSGSIRPGSLADRARMANIPIPEAALKCPRCESTNTKFCYFNNYSPSQPRHFCKTCRRYWTRGGALKSVPVGGGCRRIKRSNKGSSSSSKSPANSGDLQTSGDGGGSTSAVSTSTASLLGLISPQIPPLRFMAPLSQLTGYGPSGDVGLNYAQTSDMNFHLLGNTSLGGSGGSVKMEENHQKLNLPKQFLGIQGNDQYWTGSGFQTRYGPDVNRGPMEVPPTLSHHFSILHLLDLSYTEIKSLPQSISRLVALQKLFLRSCKLLMELPPEIGELTNLEVLDLEGTEILSLPKEIAKLVNLTCLKVSFHGYASQTVQTVIPRGVLSNLSRLIELIIDVTPYGEWWDVEVEAIIDDLRSLKQLVTLKLYLPTTILLEELKCMFPHLSNFRFTVGRHEEHFISRLPHDVEEEFNNLKKGLKYINGSHTPNEITKVFKPNAFFLQRHWTAKSLSDFGHENINEVKFCLVMECNEFRTIIDSEQFYQGKDGIVLGSLERLIIRYVKNVESIWKGPVGKGSLSNLKSLVVHTCPNLTTLLTIDMLGNLSNLEELIVEDCPKIDSLVSLKSSGSKSDLFLPSLKKISLLDVPELVSISSGLCIAPKLEKMVIFYCPKLEKLSTTEVSSTELKVIKGEKEWWDALKWYESDLSTEHEDYLARLFIPLRMDGDLMAQLTEY